MKNVYEILKGTLSAYGITQADEVIKVVADNVYKTLKVYDKCYVNLVDGILRTDVAMYLTKLHSTSFKTIATFEALDVYTVDELIINYAEQFHEFSTLYTGKRDYGMLRNATLDTKFELVHGNLQVKGENPEPAKEV